ncbi:MAG: hypothetical protein EOO20_14355 [Chryseobacterium sp.]|nr:MAG: hypothetical protein EOO20_14355 [Chryseobacterium sp.]
MTLKTYLKDSFDYFTHAGNQIIDILYACMKIKELIEKSRSSTIAYRKNSILQSDDSIYAAIEQFARSKAESLPVYEDGKFQYMLMPYPLAETVLHDYTLKREKRYELIRSLTQAITRLKTLLEAISTSTHPSKREAQIKLCIKTVGDLLQSLR